MTSLQLFILSTIHRYGPQSDMSLWNHSNKCESLKAVIIASAILAEGGFIERTPIHKIPQRYPAGIEAPCNGLVTYWQLTQIGSQHAAENAAACNAQQEVTLGS